jgi:hypothetical protein
MSHTFLVSVHAVAATVAVLTGLLALRRTGWVTTHLVSTVVMGGSLAPSLWVSRFTTPPALQLVFLGLLALSVAMGCRAWQAWRLRSRPGGAGDDRYLVAVGFNLIGLVTGLVTVGVLRLGGGGLGVTLVAVATPLLGHQLLHRYRRATTGPAVRSRRPRRRVRSRRLPTGSG